MKHKLEIYKDRSGKYRWRIRAANQKLVACSGENFTSKSNAKRAWRSFEKSVVASIVSASTSDLVTMNKFYGD